MSTRWTAPQRAAIEHVRGDLLVSAAAGSGKTAVLAERCARLVCETPVEEGGCGVESLLVLTFTEAAANEMRSRIAEAIREKLKTFGKGNLERMRWLRRQAAMVDRASISTLHGFCVRVLRQHFHAAQIDPSFEVMDEDEARLLREDALADVLGRWHEKQAAAKSGEVTPFAEFMEAYAQGRESTCRDMILAVYRMLSSTADPAGYLAGARRVYSAEGCRATLDGFVRSVVGGKLRLLALSVWRWREQVEAALGPGQMLTEMDVALQAVEESRRMVEERGAAGLPAVRAALSYKWPTLRTPKDVPDFEGIKERCREKTKKKMKDFCVDYLAADEAGLLSDLRGLAFPLETLLALVADFMTTYASGKRQQNRLDFSDLERFTLDVLTAPGSLAAAELRTRYCHLLVDEFQDINPLQAALLESLRSAERFDGAGNLFVVGDVKQSIYGFRLAAPELFLERERMALEAGETGHARHIGLPHNFRSHPHLLTAMNAFFEKLLTFEMTGIHYNQGHALEPPPAYQETAGDASLLNGLPVEMHLVVMDDPGEEGDDGEEKGGGDSASAAAAPSENLSSVEEEAGMVAQRIAAVMEEKRTLRGKDGQVRPLQYRDIAILLRSMKDRAMIFARALARRGIPVHADLATGYFETAEVRDALALLQILDNPQQDIPLATAMLGPYGRFSHDDIAGLRLTYDRKSVPFPDTVMRYPEDGRMAGTLPDAGKNVPPFDAELAARVEAFLKKIARWRSRLRTRPLHEGLAEIFAESRMFPYLSGLDAGAQRVANLQALHQRALKFAGFRKQGLHRFLRFIEKLRDQDGDFGEAPVLSEASNVVRIMSVHKSKGLEFPVVFASGLGGMLNLTERGPVYVHRDLYIGLNVADVERNIFYHSAASATIIASNQRTARAEELRLLYVALTRARDHLILTGHVKNAEVLAAHRAEWSGHAGGLPEDVLMKGKSFLDWLVPALSCCGLGTRWPGDSAADAQVKVTVHAPTGAQAAAAALDSPDNETIRRLLAAEALPDIPPPDAAAQRLRARITGTYGHGAATLQPAVMTVTALKMQQRGDDAEPGADAAAVLFTPRAAPGDRAKADASRLRGVATHRILELLDFSTCTDEEAIRGQINAMVSAKSLAADDAARADLAGILWFALHSQSGQRLRAAVSEGWQVRREIAFAWAVPLDSNSAGDPADWPTLRGVMDVLLVKAAGGEAEILDYKTDSAFTWELNRPGYERQMRYYLEAAEAILGFPVKKATLVFLGPRQEHVVVSEKPLTNRRSPAQ